MQRKRHRFSFPEEQLRQLKSTNESLRKLNDSALSQLQHIGNSYLTKEQYREASDSFEILALRINSVVQFRHGIITAARAEPEVIRVVFGTICGSCDDPLDEPQDHVPEVLKLDVAQLAEIDGLVELAHGIEERVSARCMSRGDSPQSLLHRVVSINASAATTAAALGRHGPRARYENRGARGVGWQVWAVRQTPPRR